LELLAVVHCLKSFRPHLLDRTFELRTDNASLQWFLQQRSLSHHQARWLNTISEFKFTVAHIPGRLNPADHLSRMRFPEGPAPAPSAEYDDGASELFHLAPDPPGAGTAFTQVRSATEGQRFLHADFAASALPRDSFLAPISLPFHFHFIAISLPFHCHFIAIS
jgi:hypothetical protein